MKANHIKQILLSFVFFLQIQPVFAEDPIVYSRCARTTDTITLTADVTVSGQVKQVSKVMRGLDIYDVLPDVTNFFEGFSAPCDLIYRDEQGAERVLYDCSTTSTVDNACAALDPAVSFDGKTIAFSVFRGNLYSHELQVQHQVLDENAESNYTGSISFPNQKLKTNGAHLYTVDVATGATSFKPFEDGIYDSGPAFLANGRLAFTSNRDKNTSTVVWRSTGSREGTRIWSIDLNWNNLDLASHHSLSQEQHPYLLKNGRLAYSSWQILGSQPFRHTNGNTGGFTTLDNLFHIYTQFPDGAENFALYGQHSGGHSPSYFGENHTAAHFITQTSDERIWFSDYYRGNNNGFGAVIGVMAEPDGQEGKAPEDVALHADIFVPRDVINFAPWSHNVDGASFTLTAPSIKHPSYADDLVFTGKVGHPAALPDNGLMLSWGKGACSTLATSRILVDLGIPVPPRVNGSGSGVAMNMMTSINRDIPGCDSGVYVATQIPSQHPSDLSLIVDSPNWHEIMAKAVVPYSAIHSVEMPVDIDSSADKLTHPALPKGTPFGLLGAASITDRETHPQAGIKFAGEHQFSLQGTDTINYNDEDLCGIRILSMMPNRDRNTFQGLSNLFGERVRILGEFSVLNKDKDGNSITDQSGHLDTSFLVRFPANAPYLMQSIDCKGRTLNTDMTWQSLRPGEKKTCGGCHVHSKASRISFEDSFAASNTSNLIDKYVVPRLGEGVIPLLTGKVVENNKEIVGTKEVAGYAMSIDFTRDIMPIFQQRCASCHSGDSPVAELALDILGDNKQKDTPKATWWCLVGDSSQQCLSAGNRFDTGKGTTFRRPQVSKYIRAFNSLGSLLYWKAANERTDRNTDASYADDIDFGADHPTDITADELGLLSRWIDIGVPGGNNELLDTQKPTLHMVPTSTDSVSTVKIGTADIGSGINPASLVVCVLDSQDNCSNIAGNAEMSGVIILDLNQTLTDPTIEILASVEDVTGNKTEIRRTVGFLTSGKNSNITITPINDADLVEKETYNFFVDVTDGNVVPNTIKVVASVGTVKLISGNEYMLIPPSNFNGDIFVMVIVEDDNNASDADSTSFTVSVTQLNDAPTAVSGIIATTTNTVSSEVNVEVIDPDFEDTHTITLKTEPENGSVVINGIALAYKPNSGFHGTDSFEVTATDSGGLSVDGTISVIVNQFNTAPISVSATIETTMNTASAEVNVEIVDPDLNDTHTITINTEPVNGSVAINGTALIYTPNSDFHGADSFDISVTDSGGLSIDGIISVTVNELNTAPKFETFLIETTMNTASVGVDIEVLDPDPNDTHTIVIKSDPANGSVLINGITLVYTPNSDFYGSDSFEITVTDSNGLSVSGIIDVAVNELNTAPKSATALIETSMNTVSEKVTVDIVDVDSGDAHVLTFKTEPFYGTAVIEGISLIYTPKADFFGGETFEITVTDSGGLSVDGNVNVTVAATDTGGDDTGGDDTGGGDTGGGDTGGGDTGGGDTGGGDTGGGDTGGGDTGGGDTGGGDTGGGDTGGGDTGDNVTPKEKDGGGGSFNFYLILLLMFAFSRKFVKFVTISNNK